MFSLPIIQISLAFISSFLLVLYTTPRVINIAKNLRLFDKPGRRSSHQKEIPVVGEIAYPLFYAAIFWSIFGTILMIVAGIKLPGLEFRNQRVEAAFRKELVLGEDFKENAQPIKIEDLYGGVRKIHYKMYFHYLYFNAVKWSYLQGMVIVPYLALAPTIVSGAITLGFVQQITRAFGRVENSLQYLVRSWSTIVELISVWKRLSEFEARLKYNSEESTVENI